jgi:SAM-dependent methyltransferase
VDPALAPNSGPSALAAYEALAPFYDRFTADYEHEPVLEQIEGLARQHGLSGRRLLDVACGTGKSFLPLMRRGYDVTACDISPGMVELARGKLPPDAAARVVVADMRALPWRGAFDLVTCLDDAVNYLLTDGDLQAALRGMSAALRPGGVAVFDVNSLRTYRETFAEDFAFRSEGEVFVWRGRARPDVAPGSLCSAVITVRPGAGRDRFTSRHVQRHHPRAAIEPACARANLDVCGIYGVTPSALLVDGPDEDVHRKLIYVARRPA